MFTFLSHVFLAGGWIPINKYTRIQIIIKATHILLPLVDSYDFWTQSSLFSWALPFCDLFNMNLKYP